MLAEPPPPPKPKEFIADHPFFNAVVMTQNAEILFIGTFGERSDSLPQRDGSAEAAILAKTWGTIMTTAAKGLNRDETYSCPATVYLIGRNLANNSRHLTVLTVSVLSIVLILIHLVFFCHFVYAV